MTVPRIDYHKGKFKYQLINDYMIDIDFANPSNLQADFVELSSDGILRIKRGFVWDGVTGLAFDTRNFMRAALVHDALFHLLREHGANPALHQRADEMFRRIALDDGVNRIRVSIHCTSLLLVRKLGRIPGKKRELLTAP